MTFGIGVVLLHVLFDGIRAVLQMFRSMLHICAHFIFLVGTALSPQQQVKDISSEKKVKACMHDENYNQHTCTLPFIISKKISCFSNILWLLLDRLWTCCENRFHSPNILKSIHIPYGLDKYFHTSANRRQPFQHMIYK